MFRHQHNNRDNLTFPTKEYFQDCFPSINIPKPSHIAFQNQSTQSLKKVLRISSRDIMNRLEQLQRNNQVALTLIQKNQEEIEALKNIIKGQDEEEHQIGNKIYIPMLDSGTKLRESEETEDYYLTLENYSIRYTIKVESHATRNKVYTIDCPQIKCQSKLGAIKKIESSRNLVNQICQWKSFNPGNNHVDYLRAIYNLGYGICLLDAQFALITSRVANSAILSTLTVVGKAIGHKGEISNRSLTGISNLQIPN